MNSNVSDILELSISERIQIVEDIWDSIATEKNEVPLTDDLREELDLRLEAYHKNPEDGASWEGLKDRLSRSR